MIDSLLCVLIGAALAQSPNNPTSHLLLAPAGTFLTPSMALTKSMAGMDLMTSTNALFGTQKKQSTYDFFAYQSNTAAWGETNGALPDPVGYPFSPLRNLEIASQEQWGTRWDIYNVTVYQMASSALSGSKRNEGANRFNVRADIKLWDFDGGAMGRITAQMRQTTAFPDQTDLGTAFGTDITLDSDYTGLLGTRIVRLRYEQGILDNRVMFTVGKMNPNDYLMNNPFAGDETTQFLASIFDGSDATQLGYQGYLLGAGVLCVPFEGMYANFIATAPSSNSYRGLGLEGLDTGLWWFGSEVGIVTNLFGRDDTPGKYSVGFNTTNASYTSTDLQTQAFGNGFWLMGTEYLTQDIGVWAQFTYCDPDVALYKTEFTTGFSIENCFGRKRDGFGAAFGFTTAADGGLGVQTVSELYYRFQMTDSVQITPDIAFVTNPTDPIAGANQGGGVVVFGIRVFVRF